MGRGCGADAAPYFRIFNPITQGDKFDARVNMPSDGFQSWKKCPRNLFSVPGWLPIRTR